MSTVTRRVALSWVLRQAAGLGLLAAAGAGCGGQGPPTAAAGPARPLPKPDPRPYRGTEQSPAEKPFDPRERLKGASR
jgi:hypothetical protein